uniref:Uncharacterized protein n=1 Tax=Heterorhabditis bacteriophora TaxID=37862 RepID=A0A1I7WS43_HETBA
MDVVTTQTKAMDITQQTQSGYAKKINIDQFLKNFTNCGSKASIVGSKSVEELDQKFVTNVQMILYQLGDERRQAKVFNHIRTIGENDEGRTLSDFVNSWFNLIRLLNNSEQEKLRLSILKLILLVLEDCNISCHLFVSIYNHVNRQMSECHPSSIISIFDYVREKLKTNNNLNVDDIIVNGLDYIRDIVYEWLEQSASSQMFSHVLAIIKGADIPELIDKYLVDRLFGSIEDKTQQLPLTWKAICILSSIDQKM